MFRKPRIFLACILALSGACTTTAAAPEDGENASFGGNAVKADGSYDECVVLEVLELVNEATTDAAYFDGLGLRSRAAGNIIAHRHGPDGMPGTGDDDIFDDLQELDDVPYVGPVSMEILTGAVAERCEVDLASRPFMDATTFAGSTGGGWSRDNVELEATLNITGMTGQHLQSILRSRDSRDRTIFSRIRKNELMEAFTLGYSIDEMPWDRDSHEAREAIPFVPLTIESGRYEAEAGGRRELSLGTDIMDDIYYDTDHYALLGENIVVRGRVRHDTPTEIRRLLIAAKFGAEIGDDGIKRTGKVDVRTDSPERFVATFEDDVRRGMVTWSGRETPVLPLQAVWRFMDERDLLPDISGHESVLLIEPMVHLRSTRSRYHLNVPGRSTVQGFIRNGDTQLMAAIQMAEAALMTGTLDADDTREVTDFVSFAQQVLSGDAIAARLGAAPAAVPVAFGTRVSTVDELNENRRVAEAMDALYHDAADQLNAVDRLITGTRGLDYDAYADMFIDWQRATNSSLARKRAAGPFLAEYTAMSMDADVNMMAFTTYAEAEMMADNRDFRDWEGMDATIWDALGAHLQFETLKHARRQIEYAGTVGNMLWFDQARAFYVPAARRPSGNFLIDTFDMTEMLTHEMWTTMTDDQRRIDQDLDPAKIFHTAMTNEVQIELGQETAFVARINELQELIDSGMATPAQTASLEGAQFVMAQYIGLMQILAELKGEAIIDRLEDEGAPNGLVWGPAAYGKGETALRLLADID